MSETPVFETLVDIYESSTKKFAERELFGAKKNGRWTWTTYAEFRAEVEGLRGGLAELGVVRGDRVAIISDNRVEWAVAAYACFTLGAVFVPMYEAQLAKEWEFIVRDCGAKLLVVANKEVLEKSRPLLESVPSLEHIVVIEPVSGTGAKVSSYRSCVEVGQNRKVGAIRAEPKDLACLIYTSGTTGNPKGVKLSHGNIASNVSAVHIIFPMDETDRSLSFLPWAHSFGQTCELHCLMSMGASTGLAESVQQIIPNLGEVRPTLLFSVPRIFNKLYAAVQKQLSEKPDIVQALVKDALVVAAKERDGKRLTVVEHLKLTIADKLVFSKVREKLGGRLRYAFSGGAAISRDVAEFIDAMGIMVYEGYGLTETSPIVTANCPGARKLGTIGRPIPGVRVVIDAGAGHGNNTTRQGSVSRNGTSVNVEGEIVVYGPNVMQGYHNRDEENAAVFTPDGGFRTGDQGMIDPQGFVVITGRIKEQYKLENGKYVVPTPLEEHLKLSPYVLNAFVYGDNRPYNVALLVANVEAVEQWARKEGVSGSGDALLESSRVHELFRNEIAKYGEAFKGFEAIKSFALVGEDFTTENGMLTPSLKVKRRKVLERWGDKVDGLYAKPSKKDERSARA